MTVMNSTISDNEATSGNGGVGHAAGGGIYNNSAAMTILDCKVTGNVDDAP